MSGIEHAKNCKFQPSKKFSQDAHLKSFSEYEKMYAESLDSSDTFWAKIAEGFYWKKKWDKVSDINLDLAKGPISIKWFTNAKTNITYNALDRHLEKNGEKTAFYWESNDGIESKKLSYKKVHTEVCKAANALKELGVKKGDRVAIYMPMIPELAYSVLACARIGAIHSVVFGGLAAESLSTRMIDKQCNVLVTADGCMRGTKFVPLKETADKALELCKKDGLSVSHCIVVKRMTKGAPQNIPFNKNTDVWWHEIVEKQNSVCEPEWMDAEDPLYILYTSGSTGKPKGVLHTTGGYMVYTATTFKYIFDYKPNDVYWCTADIGWVTGHSYIVYGPMLNCATQVLFEGIPTHPDASRFWQVIDKYNVNIFYTAPTAIRALHAYGDKFVTRSSRQSLRLLGSVGEPINPEAWKWYYETIGDSRCPIVDTWWQTETGGILISPIPGAIATKPGSATLPFFGVRPALFDQETKKELTGANKGILAMKSSWPGQMRTVFGDHKRFEDTYFKEIPGCYFTGDACERDGDGYYWITGRTDDVIKVSGHRIGTAEVEGSLVSNKNVAEAAVISVPHEIKGNAIYAYVTLIAGAIPSEELKKVLISQVRSDVGPFAAPEFIHWAPQLPKTRSGKIMRRILKKIAVNDLGSLGDVTTLADPGVIDQLLANAPKTN
ncbi:MAG: acetyl-coenzyme A synthetase [Proteobacteria bacterium SG_bin7]|nr:MAG: acetyl-coenzyme A synthetase [Proteobacteria bacterium SG_bin7]